MRSDSDIKRDAEFELRWDPSIDVTDIAVAVDNGVVELAGLLRNRDEKWEAESGAKRVDGMVAVVNDIEVRLPAIDERPAPDIAQEIGTALQLELPYSSEAIKVTFKDRSVTLEGNAERYYQREKAEAAVRRVRGVKGVTDTIQIKPQLDAENLRRQIQDAFRRSAEIDANHIAVAVNGREVILRGTVRSWAERKEAERTAWRAAGVTRVINELMVPVVP